MKLCLSKTVKLIFCINTTNKHSIYIHVVKNKIFLLVRMLIKTT